MPGRSLQEAEENTRSPGAHTITPRCRAIPLHYHCMSLQCFCNATPVILFHPGAVPCNTIRSSALPMQAVQCHCNATGIPLQYHCKTKYMHLCSPAIPPTDAQANYCLIGCSMIWRVSLHGTRTCTGEGILCRHSIRRIVAQGAHYLHIL